jgi:hypothetical protein
MSIKVLDEPKIELKELELDTEKQPDEYQVMQTSKSAPYITYSGELNISFDDLISMKLFNDKFLPTIEIVYNDTTNRSIDELFPLDNEIVSVLIKSSSEDYWPIRMDFKVLSFNPMKLVEGGIRYKIIGALDINYLYYRNFYSKKGTSWEVLRELSKNGRLGFATNIKNSKDKMTWINPAEQMIDFIKKITKNSYKSSDTFLFTYIDFYYNLNYIDIETQLQDRLKNKKVTLNIDQLRLDDTSNKTPEKVSLKLTNHPDYIQTNMFISQFNLDNSSTLVNLKNGYSTISHYYDISENKYIAKPVDTISTIGDGTQIVMKDQPGVNNKLTEFAISTEYYGKVDRDNCHENYLLVECQNKINLDFLQKIKMLVTLEQPNWALYRFQKILVELYKLQEVDADENAPIDNSNKINQKLSGEWLITAISYTYDNDGDEKNGIRQNITLIKRELTASYKKRQ